MNLKLNLTFEGTFLPRDIFLKRVRHTIHGFIEEETGFIMFLHEIVKNIYDHANGQGSLSLIVQEKNILFEVKDNGTQAFDLQEIKQRGSSKAGNGINFGFGLSSGGIEDMAKALHINLTIDCSHGFTYSGTYPLSSS